MNKSLGSSKPDPLTLYFVNIVPPFPQSRLVRLTANFGAKDALEAMLNEQVKRKTLDLLVAVFRLLHCFPLLREASFSDNHCYESFRAGHIRSRLPRAKSSAKLKLN